jgi:hypothetical protein
VTTAGSGPDPLPEEPGPPTEVVGGFVAFLVFAVMAALIGAATAVAAIAVHRSGPGWLALAVAASLGVAWALRSTGTPRLGAAYCMGWVGVLGVGLAGRPEGDYVLAGDTAGYVIMATGFALVVLGITSLGRGDVRTGT